MEEAKKKKREYFKREDEKDEKEKRELRSGCVMGSRAPQSARVIRRARNVERDSSIYE